MSLNFTAFLQSLPIALEGWFGVILVIFIIVVIMYLLNFIFSGKKKK